MPPKENRYDRDPAFPAIHTSMTILLDEKLRACKQHAAVFSSETTKENEENQTLDAFNTDYEKEAEALSEANPANPIGNGKPAATKRFQGFHFLWAGNRWEHQAPTHTIEIAPQCDLKDVELWLKAFQPIAKNILSRAIVKRTHLLFQLGTPQSDAHRVAYAQDSTIGFPVCQNQCHLLATKLAEASKKTANPVNIENIILHEIGHTLGKYFSEEKSDIQMTILDSFPLGQGLLQEISPHYLGDNRAKIPEKITLLKTIEALEGTEEAKKSTRQFARRLGAEIFAEMLRYYYLEPCLNKQIKKPATTKYKILLDFAHILTKEAQITLQREVGTPPFPATQQEID